MATIFMRMASVDSILDADLEVYPDLEEMYGSLATPRQAHNSRMGVIRNLIDLDESELKRMCEAEEQNVMDFLICDDGEEQTTDSGLSKIYDSLGAHDKAKMQMVQQLVMEREERKKKPRTSRAGGRRNKHKMY